MKHYTYAELDITDPGWLRGYLAAVTVMVERRGGRFLARTPKIERVEGERAPLPGVVLIEWPSREAAMEFYESDEYRPYRDARQAGARNEFYLIAGEDFSDTARIEDRAP